MEAGDTTDTQGDLETKALDVNAITPVNVASSASCPADIPLPKGMSFSWSPVCQFAEGLRPVVLAMAWLFAGVLVLGGIRQG
jgi:hypothetical protein